MDNKTNFNIACIGSRDIDEELAKQLENLGFLIANEGHTIVSGNAIGADFAYASGANKHNPALVKLYLPWNTYNWEQLVGGNQVILEHDPNWSLIAAKHHEKYDELTQGAKKMMDRNVGIVLDSVLVIGALNHKKPGMGGTGHAMRVAEANNRPFIDVSKLGVLFSVEQLIPWIQHYLDKARDK